MRITHTGENFTFSPVLLVGLTISQNEILLDTAEFPLRHHTVSLSYKNTPLFERGIFGYLDSYSSLEAISAKRLRSVLVNVICP